jgi:hypothetical protein
MFIEAAKAQTIEEFLSTVFPSTWSGIRARILESGAEFTEDCVWAARWSKIPRTERKGKNALETAVKSCIYRVHDCLHQLWGLPVPDLGFSEDDRYLFKRAGMCGEVSVLTLTEFVFCTYLYDNFPEVRDIIWRRNAVPLIKEGELKGKSTLQIAIRLDGLLHKKIRPLWVRESPIATAFCDDYVPMLEQDRMFLDIHWDAMKVANWIPIQAPNSRYSKNLDGLELTSWMIEDFYHLMQTDERVDLPLREFNRQRRALIKLPKNWTV